MWTTARDASILAGIRCEVFARQTAIRRCIIPGLRLSLAINPRGAIVSRSIARRGGGTIAAS